MVAAIAVPKQMISIAIQGAMKLFLGHFKEKKTGRTICPTGSLTLPVAFMVCWTSIGYPQYFLCSESFVCR
jgi:hypothetical protein